MTAKHETTKYFDLPRKQLFEAAKASLRACRCTITNENEQHGIIDARSRINIWSWTEEIEVRISSSGEVYMESRCYIPTQVVDWGKNKKNVNKFFAELEGRM